MKETSPTRVFGWSAATWGVFGVSALLGSAVVRLWPLVTAAFERETGPLFWLSVVGSLTFFGYAEGYRAFQKQFAPRVVARALTLTERPSLLRALLAPLFCMGFFAATRRRMLTSWVLTLSLIALVASMRFVPQPWRGVVDLGVVVALLWGIVSMLVLSVAALRGQRPDVPTDLPPH